MALLLPPPPQNPVSNSFEWREWFYALYTKFANNGSGISFNSLDFAGSNIDSIVTRDHNTLTNIQGGDSLNRNHLSQIEYASVQALKDMSTQLSSAVNITGGSIAGTILPTGGISATITTAALTITGTQGSMTFTNGILTAQTQAT